MEEGLTHADYLAARSGWTTTKVAAQALGIDPRTVRKYIKQGKLVAKAEGQGVEKTYLVSIDSVYAMRDSRTDPGMGRERSPRESASSELSEDLVALVRELASEARHSSSEAAELRTRLELTERTESSLREALEQRLETEQLRREQAERERDELAARLAELEPTSEPRESDVIASEEQSDANIPPEEQEQEKRSERGWWRRLFGS